MGDSDRQQQQYQTPVFSLWEGVAHGKLDPVRFLSKVALWQYNLLQSFPLGDR
ncbi:MAG TPA: hypothetical protein V6D19_21545 [Stenomitos sp.]